MDPTTWHPMVNTGALAAFAIFVIWSSWRIVSVAGAKAYVLGERYVASTESLHETLRVSDMQQKELCTKHNESIVALNDTFDASLKIQQVTCDRMQRLVEIHESPEGSVTRGIDTIGRTHSDVRRMKRAAKRACDMVRVVAKAEFPNTAAEVERHCSEIERLIGDSGEFDLDIQEPKQP